MITREVKGKLYGQSAEAVQAVMDELLNIFKGYSSPILKSQPSGWHAFMTLEVDER